MAQLTVIIPEGCVRKGLRIGRLLFFVFSYFLILASSRDVIANTGHCHKIGRRSFSPYTMQQKMSKCDDSSTATNLVALSLCQYIPEINRQVPLNGADNRTVDGTNFAKGWKTTPYKIWHSKTVYPFLQRCPSFSFFPSNEQTAVLHWWKKSALI